MAMHRFITSRTSLLASLKSRSLLRVYRPLRLHALPVRISALHTMSLPKTMKAITYAKNGGVDVLELTPDLPVPVPAPTDVIIRVAYAGVNFIDTYFRAGLYPTETFPGVVGMEVAGTVVALPTDAAALAHPEFQKRNLKVGSKVATWKKGSHAEYVTSPWANVVPVPEGVPPSTAGGALLQGLTALTFMTDAYDVKKGDTVLVHTVAGGLGLLFAQLAKARGATVIGTTSTEAKADVARAAGADHVIIYKSENTVQRVLELTGGKGVEAIFDGVGKDTFEGNFEMIKRKGTIVSVGNASGAVPPFAPLKLSAKNVKLARPTMMGYLAEPEETSAYGAQLFELIAAGTLKVAIHKEYPFSAQGVRDAQTDLVAGQTTGKLVIKVADEV